MRKVMRKEKKFLLNLASAKQAECNLAAILAADPHNGFHGYPVRSLYFDTLHDRDYAEKCAFASMTQRRILPFWS